MLPPDPNRTPQTPLRSRSFVREIGPGMDRPSVRAPMLTPLGTRAPVGQAAAPPAAMPSVAMSSPALPLARPSLARPGAAPRPNRAAGPTYRGLPKWLRYVLLVVAALAIGAVIGATAPTALMRLGAVAALQPGLLAWYTARTLGFLAYLVVAGSVLYGLLLSTKILDAIAHRPVSFALHKDLAVVGFVLAILHATVLLADQSFAFTPRAILVPFASPYAAVWVGIGQLTFYGLAVITASFYVRRQIGQRAWRLLHYLTFLVFIGAIGHGVMAGSDAGAAWAFWLYLVPGATAVFLLVYRIVISVAAHMSGSESDRPVAMSPLIARAPTPFPGDRVPSGRPASPLEPPIQGPTYD